MRSIVGLTGVVRDKDRSLSFTRSVVDDLNNALSHFRKKGKDDALRDLLEPVAASLAEGAAELSRSTDGDLVVAIAHVRGGSVTCKFTLRHCVAQNGGSRWVNEAEWTAEVADERDYEIAAIRPPVSQADQRRLVDRLIGLVAEVESALVAPKVGGEFVIGGE
jgi:hypothetical protein